MIRHTYAFLLSISMFIYTATYADDNYDSLNRKIDSIQKYLMHKDKKEFNDDNKIGIDFSKKNELLSEIKSMHDELNEMRNFITKIHSKLRADNISLYTKVRNLDDKISAYIRNSSVIEDITFHLNQADHHDSINRQNISKTLESKAQMAFNDAFIQTKNFLNSKKDKDYKKIRTIMRKFIDTYPNSILVSNALFWIAESYMHEGFTENAVVEYLSAYQHYPKGPRASEILSKMSSALLKLGKISQVCKVIAKVHKEFEYLSDATKVELENNSSKAGCN